MRKSLYLVSISILLSLTFNVSGQNKKSTNFDILINGGLSLPVGSYREKNALKAAIYANPYQVKGFYKEKCGFAKLGYNYNLQINYRIASSFKIVLIGGIFSNPVETQGMSELIYQLSSFTVEEENYKYFFINPGVGYYINRNRFDFGLNATCGYIQAKFPYYKFVDPYPMIFAHDGPRPNLGAINYGVSLSAFYHIARRLSIGIDVGYQTAKFKYKVNPRLIPGGGGSDLSFTDILKVRVINAGIKLVYNL